MLKGLNHLTLAVTDLAVSVDFYQNVLQMTLHARWDSGAYLTCGDLWLCLSYDESRQRLSADCSDYTHYAFSLEQRDFAVFCARLPEEALSGYGVLSAVITVINGYPAFCC